ncbi:MAG TPA: EAL domain-containing protein [Thermoanaerobaculia bacterium]|jgi:EAL domain-containing protein (putative c-di-GMP-specific phosphodiesterase class I)/CheY-like chemotaxis protein|nr:EAL domain-containing protein [Thermoanaerobaculia bacterium]
MSRPVVLIADDDEEVALLLRTYLKPLDVEVLVARDGEEALAIAQSRLPAAVLLDVMMPKRSGWEVCQALKAVQRTSQIGVILVTGRGDVKDRLTGLQVGADDYLVKPFDRNEVTKRVQAVLNRAPELRKEASQAGRSALESALLDRATALPTLPIVLDRVKEILIEQGEIGIVFIDLEQFEAVEAEYGWAFFDELLCNVGQIVSAEAKERFRNPLVTCHRTGGSSFYIFYETRGQDLTAENASERIANDMRQRLIDTTKQRFPSIAADQIGFFVGSARIDYRPQIRLERQVYHGMQTAADAVRDAEQQRKKQLIRELRDIIRRKRITTLFQPIVRARESTVFGYEILTRGPASSSFRNSDMLFSFAREAKLAWALEAIALEGALRRLRQVDFADRKFLLNLEAEMFGESEFRIHEMVTFFAEHRGHFVFELTERAAIEDYAQFRELLSEFRDKGIEVAIDDAGSGYASLEAIAALAPDYLKITKGLVSTLAEEPIKQDLVRMLVDLAGKINAKTIAEGIETQEEYETCRELGIDLLQGYYLAHPQEELRAGDEEVAAALS